MCTCIPLLAERETTAQLPSIYTESLNKNQKDKTKYQPTNKILLATSAKNISICAVRWAVKIMVEVIYFRAETTSPSWAVTWEWSGFLANHQCWSHMTCSLKDTDDKIILPLQQYISLTHIYLALYMNPKSGYADYVIMHLKGPYFQTLIWANRSATPESLLKSHTIRSYSRANESKFPVFTKSVGDSCTSLF